MENWKQIDCLPGYGGIIEVSDVGRVRVSGRRYLLRTRLSGIVEQSKPDQFIAGEVLVSGYRQVAFYVKRKRFRFLVHRLVGQVFVPGYDPRLSINHINGDKLDNRAVNLEWVTLSVNTKKQWQMGLVNLRGERHPSSKLTDRQMTEIEQRLKDPNVVYRRLAAEYKVSDTLIYKIRKGRRYRQGARHRH